jgi:hypothetical protein
MLPQHLDFVALVTSQPLNTQKMMLIRKNSKKKGTPILYFLGIDFRIYKAPSLVHHPVSRPESKNE